MSTKNPQQVRNKSTSSHNKSTINKSRTNPQQIDVLEFGRKSVTSIVVVVITFFNHNFVNCKATLILEIKNLRNKIQYMSK